MLFFDTLIDYDLLNRVDIFYFFPLIYEAEVKNEQYHPSFIHFIRSEILKDE